MLESLMDDDDCPPVSPVLGHAQRGRPLPGRGDPNLGGAPVRIPLRAGAVARAGGWAGRRGHVQQAVLADLADLSEYSIYLCGSPAMIADAKHAFLARGADLERIYTDGFSFQHATPGAGPRSMRHITDAMVDAVLEPRAVQRALTDAYRSLGEGKAALQPRIRTEAGGIKLSTLGAVLPQQGVVGAKVYTTSAGKFTFVILLFSAVDGRALASFDAAAITRLRTAAGSVIAARHLARPESRRLAVFGLGTQGRAHALQMAQAFPLTEIRVCSRSVTEASARELQDLCGVEVRACEAAAALDSADIVVTASRSRTPLFRGEQLCRALSSLPSARACPTPASSTTPRWHALR